MFCDSGESPRIEIDHAFPAGHIGAVKRWQGKISPYAENINCKPPIFSHEHGPRFRTADGAMQSTTSRNFSAANRSTLAHLICIPSCFFNAVNLLKPRNDYSRPLQSTHSPIRHFTITDSPKLAKNRLTTPLFDTERLTRHLEAAYQTMYERAQRGEPPASFTVESLPPKI